MWLYLTVDPLCRDVTNSEAENEAANLSTGLLIIGNQTGEIRDWSI